MKLNITTEPFQIVTGELYFIVNILITDCVHVRLDFLLLPILRNDINPSHSENLSDSGVRKRK